MIRDKSKPQDPRTLQTIVINIINICNMTCPQCAYVKPNHFKFMSLSLFSKILQQSEDLGVKTLRLLGLSEPTLHPQFEDVLKLATKHGSLYIHLITNGTSLVEAKGRNILLRNPPNLLEVSLDAHTHQTYKLIRGGSQKAFENVVNGTKRYAMDLRKHRANKLDDKRFPKVSVSFVLHPESVHEADSFSEEWEKYVDEIRFRGPHNFSGRANAINSISSSYSNLKPSAPCGFINSKLFVNHDGRIQACTLDFDSIFVLGNLTKGDTLLSAWHHSTREELLHMHYNSKELPEQCKSCSRCPDLK